MSDPRRRRPEDGISVAQAGVLGHPVPPGIDAVEPARPDRRRTCALQSRRVIFTLVEQVRRLAHDPFEYLEWVFRRLPGMTNQDDFEPLLPVNWAAAKEAAEDPPPSARTRAA